MYLLDANVFIQAKDSYYGMSFRPALKNARIRNLALAASLLLVLPTMVSQPYFGFGVDNAHVDEEYVADNALTDMLYGSYAFNEYVAVELSYTHLDTLDWKRYGFILGVG